MKEILSETLQKHKHEAVAEFEFYKTCGNEAKEVPDNGAVHLTFDFAEKVLLPSLLRKPGQLHFVTGLKFDIFGICSSNLDLVYVFGLVEGHWPNNKTGNEVCSMIHHVIDIHTASERFQNPIENLTLHCDNCSGQNKNRYVLWYFCWRVIMGLEKSITLYFLVAGHTKNRCDGAFGLVKRKLKTVNVDCPAQMMKVIQESSKSNEVICGSSVKWTDWKAMLGPLFTVPKTFKISNYHAFSFHFNHPGILRAKEFTSTAEWTAFNLLRKKCSVEDVKAKTSSYNDPSNYCIEVNRLSDVPSPHEGTREAYLKKNVCEQYHPEDDTYVANYFGSGMDWGEHPL